MSNQDIGSEIAGVEATTRKVTVDVLAVKGQASGATARFVLRFRTDGDVQRKVEVRGRLFLTPGADGWRIFGYDVTKGAVGVMTGRLAWVRRLVTLAVVLAVAAVVVPDSAVKPTQMELVKINRATGVDYPESSKDVVWILAVGSDARPGEDMTRVRGDALQLVGMNLRTGAATAIGVPRDSWVPIPGYGSNKINAALYFGGPQALGRAVGQPGRHPAGLRVREPLQVLPGADRQHRRHRHPEPASRSATPTSSPRASGRAALHLGPYDAMVFSRIRHNLIRGDFDRSANQQRVLRGIQAKVRARAHEPGFLESGVMHVMQYLHTDLPPTELFQLAQAVAQVDPRRSPPASSRAASATSAAPAWCCPTPTRPAASATAPATTPRWSPARSQIACGGLGRRRRRTTAAGESVGR